MAAVYQLKIKYDQDKYRVGFFLDAFDMISFPFVHKHVVNEHHIMQKSHNAIQEKCRNVLHDWFETNLQHHEHCSEGSKKNCVYLGLLVLLI